MNNNSRYINENYDSFPKFIQEFIDYRRRGDLTQTSTIKSYLIKFIHFHQWLYENVETCHNENLENFTLEEISTVRKKHIIQYLSFLERENIGTSDNDKYRSVSTINAYIASLKSVFNFLCNQAENEDGTPYLLNNVMAKIEFSIKKETYNARSRRLSNHILNSEEEINLFIEFIDDHYYEAIKGSRQKVAFYKKYKHRDRCILRVLILSGIRVSELCALKEKDIDFRNQQIKILRKGNKDDVIYVSEDLINILDDYILSKKNHVKNGYIFSNDDNPEKPLTDRTVRNITHRYSKLFGVDMSPHKIRHTHATWLLNKHNDIPTVMSQLGHNNSDTTFQYINNDGTKVKSIMNSLYTHKNDE